MSSKFESRQSLVVALGASLLLHGAVLVAAGLMRASAKDNASAPMKPPASPLAATLLKPPPPTALVMPAAQPSLSLPPPPRRPAAVAKPATPPASPPKPAPTPTQTVQTTVVVRQALAQLAEHLLYPVEAVNQGLEGEVLVMMFLDPSGNVVAARVERGSGHAILDQAAVTAARRLRALPASASTEVLLPVRFRLN